ncbi:MAG: hypothetical protein ACE5HE_03550 [Phycisphaerae bacterium]
MTRSRTNSMCHTLAPYWTAAFLACSLSSSAMADMSVASRGDDVGSAPVLDLAIVGDRGDTAVDSLAVPMSGEVFGIPGDTTQLADHTFRTDGAASSAQMGIDYAAGVLVSAVPVARNERDGLPVDNVTAAAAGWPTTPVTQGVQFGSSAPADPTALGDVQVLGIAWVDGTAAQSQLALVPAPGAFALGVLGLSVVGLVLRRRS